jgi:Zn-dependent peptidase ImmA (M78 family)
VREVPGAGDSFGLYSRTCDITAQQKGFCKVNNRIYLEAGRPLIQEQTTLLHEIQHAVLGIDKSTEKNNPSRNESVFFLDTFTPAV